MMSWLYALAAPIALALVAYAFGRKPLCQRIEEHLVAIQYEHANWISMCLKWSRGGYDEEAKLAAKQVEVLRGEINFYRRMLERLQRNRTEKA